MLTAAVTVCGIFPVHAAQASGAYWVTAAMLQPDNFCYWARDPIGNRISDKADPQFFGILQYQRHDAASHQNRFDKGLPALVKN